MTAQPQVTRRESGPPAHDPVLPARNRARTLVLVGMWLQPLIIHRTGIPLASVGLVLLATAVAADHLRAKIPIPKASLVTTFAYAGLIWAAFGAFQEPSLRNLVVWATLLFAVLIGPFVAGADLETVKTCILRSSRWGLLLSVVAVVIENFRSPSLLGLLTTVQNPNRSTALTANPNAGAVYLMAGIVLVWGLQPWRGVSPVKRFFHIALLASGVWALLQTGSRAALLGTVCAVIVGLYVYADKAPRKGFSLATKPLAAGAVAACVLVYYGSGPQILQSYLDQQARLDAANDRTEIWGVALKQISESPLFGSSQFGVAGLTVNNAHNTLLEAALRYGIPGLALLLAIFAALFVTCMRRRFTTDTAWAGLLLLVAAVVHSLTHTGILDNTLLWVLISALASRPSNVRLAGLPLVVKSSPERAGPHSTQS